MALSPIQIYQNNQSSLAQILQGGNQTVMSILDKAVQIGRDISNKQTAQERDLIGMRAQETAMAQRRGENLQQDLEDTRRFNRGVFESDRRASLDDRQETRATARDIFSMQDQSTRTGIAQDELGLRQEAFTLEKQEAGRKNSAWDAEQARIDAMFAGQPDSADAIQEEPTAAVSTGPSTTSPGSVARSMAASPASIFGPSSSPQPTPTAPASPAPAVAPSSDSERRRLGEMKALYARSKDPRLAGEIEVLDARLNPPTGAKQPTAEDIELKRLRLEKARRENTASLVDSNITFNPRVFGAQGTGEVQSLMKFAAEKGMRPEDALYSKDFDEYFGSGATKIRSGVIASQQDAKKREIAAVNAAASEEDYVNAPTGLNENEKQIRRETYRAIRGGKSDTAPSAGVGANPYRKWYDP